MPYREPENPKKAYAEVRTMDVELPWWRFGRPFKETLIRVVPYLSVDDLHKEAVERVEVVYCRKWELISANGRVYQYQLMDGTFLVLWNKPGNIQSREPYGYVEVYHGIDFGYCSGAHFNRRLRQGKFSEVKSTQLTATTFQYRDEKLETSMENVISLGDVKIPKFLRKAQVRVEKAEKRIEKIQKRVSEIEVPADFVSKKMKIY